MGQRVPVRAGDVEFYVEVAEGGDGGGDADTTRGMQTIGDGCPADLGMLLLTCAYAARALAP
jgi:hypothetical protein